MSFIPFKYENLYSPMPCHDCSLLSISDSIPSPNVSNHAWFLIEKDKNTALSYNLWPHEYDYIQCCWDHVDIPVQALQHHHGKRINFMNWHHNIS